MTFDECIESLKEGSVITFKEYTLDRHERKKLSLSVEDGIVQKVFAADEVLNRDVLIEYYGEDLDDITYRQLSSMNCPRVVVGLGLNAEGTLNIKILILNRDFYNMGLQTIEVTNEVDPSSLLDEPNYLLAQRGWN